MIRFAATVPAANCLKKPEKALPADFACVSTVFMPVDSFRTLSLNWRNSSRAEAISLRIAEMSAWISKPACSFKPWMSISVTGSLLPGASAMKASHDPKALDRRLLAGVPHLSPGQGKPAPRPISTRRSRK